jgi:LemA protein
MGKTAVLGCLGVLVLVLVVGALLGMGNYNRLVGLSQAVDAQWAQVENVYQRRADLVPNLVATVQGAANFEKSTLEAVTEARASVGRANVDMSKLPDNPAAFAQFEQAQQQLSSALQRLMVVVERYPELKATEAFRDLNAQLEGTENRIAVERNKFNTRAQEYNTARATFPTLVFARIFGFNEKSYFRAQAGADRAPTVNFDFSASPTPAPAR